MEFRPDNAAICALEPRKPPTVESLYDADGEFVRLAIVPDDVFTELWAAYEQRHAEWRRLRDDALRHGPVIAVGTFQTSKGATVSGTAKQTADWTWTWDEVWI